MSFAFAYLDFELVVFLPISRSQTGKTQSWASKGGARGCQTSVDFEF